MNYGKENPHRNIPETSGKRILHEERAPSPQTLDFTGAQSITPEWRARSVSQRVPLIWNSPWGLPRCPQGVGLVATSCKDCPHSFWAPVARAPLLPLVRDQQLQEMVMIIPEADLGWNFTISVLTQGSFPGNRSGDGSEELLPLCL